MKTNTCLAFGFAFLMATSAVAQLHPKVYYVPDAATAVKVAEAVLVPVYGKEQIQSEEPFTAKLKNGVWTVSGTLHCSDGNGGTTTSCVGGVAVVEISKADAHILSMVHYK